MAALASLLRRRGHRADVLLRALSTTPAEPVLTASAAKARLRREYDPDRVVSLFSEIDAASLSAGSTRHALSLAVRRLSRSRRSADAEALLSSHLPASPTEPHLASIICSYASASLPEQALSAFRSAAPSLPSPISPLPFNALLSVFVRCRRHRRVPALFTELSNEFSITPNATSYAILIKAYCVVRKDAKAQQVFDQMRNQGISPTTTMYTTLIDSMYKQDKTEQAERLWKKMLENGCKPDQATYNAKAMYYALKGNTEEVLEVMSEMEVARVKPDTITYNFLMTSYCKGGKVEDAKRVYSSLGEKGCSANAATFKHMLAELCGHGDFDGGLEIFEESLKKNKLPDFRTMKGLVEGLTKADRMADAKKVVTKVKKKFPDDMLSGWKKLEEELGLNSDSGYLSSQAECDEPLDEAEAEAAETAPQAECDEPLDEADTAEALEFEESYAKETESASGESSDDEIPTPEASTL